MNKSWFGKKRVDASDLAEMLSDALNQAFQRNLPDPQEIADSIAKAIENANFSTADHMGKVKAEYQGAQKELLDRWDAVIRELQANREAMVELPGNLQSALSAETDRWKSAVTDFGARMDEVPVKLASVLDEQGQKTGEMLQQMARTFSDQVAENGKFRENRTVARGKNRVRGESGSAMKP